MTASSETVEAQLRLSPVKRFVASRRWFLLIPLAIITVMVATAVLADFLTPYSATDISLSDRLRPPFWEPGGSLAHPLGTDPMGRDLLTRMIYGARVSLLVAVLALLVGGGIGAALGLIAGYYGGRLDALVMRVADTTMAFPIILFAILFVVIIGSSLATTVFAVALVLWARYARVIRGEVLSLRERDFVAQARIAGCSSARIMLVHLFPNILNTLVVLLSLQVGWVIIVEASLSFLGAGIPPPTPTWGSMIAEGRDYIATAWWVSFFPGLAILATVLSFNLFGDWLRDALDPKLRQL
ncbi:MAG TPA: ABC transporter permease [Candidatus Tectomicrobia bacterium]|jgi:peptide/nickel transport system permease protein|nr:ABC transporter permease [Candidatus Tectomicrobia bacterium]